MNIKLSLALLVTFTLLGCGGGGGSSSSQELTSTTSIETVDDAKSNFKALSALSSFDTVSGYSAKANSLISLKTTTRSCETGTISITENLTSNIIVANNCIVGTTYMHGTMSLEELSAGSMKLVLSTLTLRDADLELSVNSLVALSNETEHWSTIDGDMQIISKCFSGGYNLKTVEKIYDAQDGSDNAESGILELNGVRYTFDNPYVTIKTATEEEVILQSELEKRMSTSTTCSE